MLCPDTPIFISSDNDIPLLICLITSRILYESKFWFRSLLTEIEIVFDYTQRLKNATVYCEFYKGPPHTWTFPHG